MILIGVSIFLFLALLILLIRLFRIINSVNELKSKTELSVSDEHAMIIEFPGTGPVKSIADNFNKTITVNQKLKITLHELDSLKTEKEELDRSIKNVQHTLNQLSLINNIGKEITSKLTREEIIHDVAKVLSSSSRITELHFLLKFRKKQVAHYIFNGKGTVVIADNSWLNTSNNIAKWCLENQKEILLVDAISDFTRYVSSSVLMYNGKPAYSVAGVPFEYQNKITGCIVAFSDKHSDYDSYLVELMKSLITYLAVAVENAQLYETIDLERKKSDHLLLNILPSQTAEELKSTGTNKPKYFSNVSVMFTDFVDFTKKAERMKPEELVSELDYCFSRFDEITRKNGVEKIKTIGDAYMCVAGLPDESSDHAEKLIRAALEIDEFLVKYSAEKKNSGKGSFEARIGIHSGPVVAGVVGKSKFAYDIWGDTVNVAARMEQQGQAGKINISGTTYELIKEKFICTYRGKIQAKNKGEIDMYFVE